MKMVNLESEVYSTNVRSLLPPSAVAKVGCLLISLSDQAGVKSPAQPSGSERPIRFFHAVWHLRTAFWVSKPGSNVRYASACRDFIEHYVGT